MVVKCPKCKVKLTIADEKIAPEGTRFKCPKCTTILLVKKPAAKPAGAAKPKALDKNKVLIAIGRNDIVQKMSTILAGDGFTVTVSADGVDAMVKAAKELPYTAIIDVSLPKIYGHEVCKRLKTGAETRDIKVILYTAVHDKDKYRRPPSSLYGADGYVEEHEVVSGLLNKVHSLVTGASLTKEPEKEPVREPAQREAPSPEPLPGAPEVKQVVAPGAPAVGDDEWVGKAKRLARTVLADVFLYNPQKAEDALRSGNFMNIFSQEIHEGRKLYEARIPQDVRNKGDFFEVEVHSFLEEKKKNLNI